MAYDAQTADRVRKKLARREDIDEMKMFGGVGFLLNGNMCVGVWKEYLILRLGPEAAGAALKNAHTREFDITGRVMKGWVMVEPKGFKTEDHLAAWIKEAVGFVRTLKPKDGFG